MDKFTEFVKTHKFTVIFVVLGLLFAILFMTIGFWRTLLLLVLVAVCFFVGFMLDQSGAEGLKAFFSRLFSGKKQ